MTPSDAFSVANAVALVTWLAMIVAPGQRLIVGRLAGGVVPVLLAAAYAVILASAWSGASGSFSSLSGVATLFDNEWLLLAGWIHYLAFDLLVGRWELLDARSRGIPHLVVVPCLLGTFMFGPVGWLLYVVLRIGWSPASLRHEKAEGVPFVA
jgi:hypothetical protein